MATFSESATPDDAALLERCRSGDAAAWRSLIERYSRLVYAMARRQGLDNSACDDVAQETFSILVRRLPELRRDTALPKWLMVTTLNVARSWRRRNRRDDHVTADGIDLVHDMVGALELEEQLQAVRDALHRLGGRCETLLKALYQQEPAPSYQQIAQILGIPIGAIGPTRARCLEKLLRLWRGADPDEEEPTGS